MERKPYILLFILITILAFILGFRIGQKTEKTNEAIDYVLSITPTPKPPTPTPVKYLEMKSKRWGLNLIYPSNLKVKESTNTPEIKFEIINE
jgi:hypothetical protein